MLSKKITSILIVGAIIGTTFTACKKEKNVMDEEANNVNNIADQAADGSLTSYTMANTDDGILSVCAIVTITGKLLL